MFNTNFIYHWSMRFGRALFSFWLGVSLTAGLLMLLGGLALPARAASAATITVDTTADEFGAGAGCSLREAIQSANTNAAFGGCAAGDSGADTIDLPAGTYTLTRAGANEDFNGTGDLDVVTDTAGLILNGTGATSATVVIDANGLDRVLHAPSAPMTLTNLAIRGGNVIGNGGGALFFGAASVTETTFTSNSANSSGGGAYFFSAASVTGTTFLSNTVRGGSGGGAYFNNTANVTGTTFTSNTAAFDGGGAFFSGATSVTGTTFTGNTAVFDGGGAAFFATADVTGTTFTSNTANNWGGGAFFIDVSAMQLVNTLFARNHATNTGAAVMVFTANPLRLVHVTIVSPTLASGAAVYVLSGTVYLTNTIVASHTTGIENVGGTVSENYNLFYGNTATLSGTIASGGHSLTGTAGFADPASDDYQLTSSSAAIDSGTDAGIAFDYFGDIRPQHGGYDIGYDELPFAIAAHTLTVTLAGNGTGTVTSAPGGVNCGATCAASFTAGTVVTLTAIPTGGSFFTGWSGAGCSGTGTCVVTMDAAKDVTANFAIYKLYLPLILR